MKRTLTLVLAAMTCLGGACPGSDPGADTLPPRLCEESVTPPARSTNQGGQQSPADVDSSDWVQRGMGGGGALYSVSVSPYATGELYIATDMGRFFHTADAGATWTPLHTSTLMGGVDSQVRFTSDPAVLYTVDLRDDRRRPVKSVDGGAHWSPLPGDPIGAEDSDEGHLRLFADPAATSRVLLCSYTEIYFSGDGGDTFSLVYTSTAEPFAGGVFWDSPRIYIGTVDGLVVSSDDGASFSLFTAPGLPAHHAIVSLAGAREGGSVRLLAVTADHDDVWVDVAPTDLMWSTPQVYRLDDPDGGGAWVRVAEDLPEAHAPVFVAMSPGVTDVAWLAGSDVELSAPIVYRTADSGASWDSVFQTENNANIQTGWSGDGAPNSWDFGEVALGFGLDPRDPQTAVLTDFGFAHVTTDAGQTWRAAYVRPASLNAAGSASSASKGYVGSGIEDTSAWWVHWTGQATLVAQTDVRGMRSLDGGESWTNLRGTGLDLNSTYQIIEQPGTGDLYAATSEVHDIYQSTRLGDEPLDLETGAVMRSSDAGASWQLAWDAGHPVVWLALDPSDADTLYASVVHSAEGGIYVTHDLRTSSPSWTKLSEPPHTQGHPFTVLVLDDGSILASYSGRRGADDEFTPSSGVFLSTDGGASWDDRSACGMYYWTKDLVVDPHDPTQNTWYVGVFSHWGMADSEVGGVYRTTDRGATWAWLTDLYRVESIAIHPTDSNVALVTTETEGLWQTTDLASSQPTFTRVDAYPFHHPTRAFFALGDPTEVWVTSFGGGVYTGPAPVH